MSEYIIKRLTNENIGDLIYLYRNAFNIEIDIDTLRKKFNTEDFGQANVGFLAYSEEGEPAAFYGILPCYIKYNNSLIYAAQAVDAMTHEKHQRQGLFVKLAQKTFEYAQQIGIKVVFGFPNENSFSGHLTKLSWIHDEDLQIYICSVRCIPWDRIRRWFGITEKEYQSICRRILSFYKKGKVPFDNSAIDQNFGGIDHSIEFYRYKTYYKNYILSICGKSVWVKPVDQYLFIGDIERCDSETLIKIVQKLKHLCYLTGLSYMRYHCSPGVFLEEHFKTHGWELANTFPIGYISYDKGIDMKKIKFTTADADTF